MTQTEVNLADLAAKEKSFNWDKPDRCPRCRFSKLWGHGYVQAYFAGFDGVFYLKRYRCPNCRCIITMKPVGYWKKYQSSIQAIYDTLLYKLINLKWHNSVIRQRAGHWLRKFIAKIKMDYGHHNGGDGLVQRLTMLFGKQIPFFG